MFNLHNTKEETITSLNLRFIKLPVENDVKSEVVNTHSHK